MPGSKRRHTATEIAGKLRQADMLLAEGKLQSEVARALGISVMTLHRWRKARPQQQPSVALPLGEKSAATTRLSESELQSRVAELQLENARLRRLVTDLLLEKMRLEEEANRHSSRPQSK